MSSEYDKERFQEISQKEGKLEESDRELLLDISSKIDRERSARVRKALFDNIFWLIFIALIAVIIWLVVWVINH